MSPSLGLSLCLSLCLPLFLCLFLSQIPSDDPSLLVEWFSVSSAPGVIDKLTWYQRLEDFFSQHGTSSDLGVKHN